MAYLQYDLRFLLEHIKASVRYRTLKEFTSIHGIGPLKASQLYREGCRSLEDLDRVYGSDLESDAVDPLSWSGVISGVRSALELRNDLGQTSVLTLLHITAAITLD